jgi:hypothetical protein
MKKARSKKSRDTVPLRQIVNYLLDCWHIALDKSVSLRMFLIFIKVQDVQYLFLTSDTVGLLLLLPHHIAG